MSINIQRIAAGVAVAVCLGTASSASADKFAGEWMAFGGGARPLGMAGAFVAVSDDASSVYWNPAGVSGQPKREVMLMHAEQFGSLVDYNFGSFVWPIKLMGPERETGLGFALMHLGVDDIIRTDQLTWQEVNGEPGFQPEEGDQLLFDANTLPKETNNDYAFLGTFAFNTKFGRWGGTLKILYTDGIAGNSATGIGIDVGYLYRNLWRDLSVGVKLQDITTTQLSWSTGTNEFIAPSVVLGGSYKFVSESMKGSLLLAADGHFYFSNRQSADQFWAGTTSADLLLGAELGFQDKVFVRGGMDAENPTAGAGIRIGPVGLDYAYLHHDSFDSTHRVSAQVSF